MRRTGAPVDIGEQQMAMLSIVSGAQIGMLCAAVRNGGLFCVQHIVVRTALWWTGSAPRLMQGFWITQQDSSHCCGKWAAATSSSTDS
jgi:hypothetical protein